MRRGAAATTCARARITRCPQTQQRHATVTVCFVLSFGTTSAPLVSGADTLTDLRFFSNTFHSLTVLSLVVSRKRAYREIFSGSQTFVQTTHLILPFAPTNL
jgi:hypothetical protein